jgi:polyferredoxin
VLKIIAKRRWVQAISALGINTYLPSWLKGEIFQGQVKGVCVPALNCYSCPSAVGACPIGALQNSFGALRFNLSLAQYQFGLYVVGFLGAVGSLAGRIPCGWLCPFGLIQELLYKIRSPKLKLPRILRSFKYLVLASTVVLLPLLVVDEFGYGETWFCKWICPAGTLEAGIPLVLLNSGIRNQIAFMFKWKMAILLLFLVWMVLTQRVFCRTTCPLGAIFGLFNKASLFRLTVDGERCLKCEKCSRDCPVGLHPNETPNSPECIRCLKCVNSCQYGAIDYEFLRRKPVRPAQGGSHDFSSFFPLEEGGDRIGKERRYCLK